MDDTFDPRLVVVDGSDSALAAAVELFDQEVIFGLEKDNPIMVSFRRDLDAETATLHGMGERLSLACLVGTEVAARSLLNLEPVLGEWLGAGAVADSIMRGRRWASLGGDLVHPRFRRRGLQALMIRYRLDELARRGYDYAISSMLEPNQASYRNYLAQGFSLIGRKRVEWGAHAMAGISSDEVLIVGRALAA
ncbi:MAG: GNAT family N-acetyltransferase [Coriobacteriales bacterium]|jgi:GNAT superfamily N-acetyltransferase|nr:GNAT family N-acetyltransferase [Coriobacteriales bacterium]